MSIALKKYVRLGWGEGIPLKKDRNRWERGALMVLIIAREINTKKVFLIVYFHLRFGIA